MAHNLTTSTHTSTPLTLKQYLDYILKHRHKALNTQRCLNHLYLLERVYVLTDSSNICFDVDLLTIQLECRLGFPQLIRSIVEHAQWIHQSRCASTCHMFPDHMTSILTQYPYQDEHKIKDPIRQFLHSPEWYSVWRNIGDDLFRHLLLNTIMLLNIDPLSNTNTSCENPKILIQLSGRLFTYSLQQAYWKHWLTKIPQRCKRLCRPKDNTDTQVLLENPLLERCQRQNRRYRRKRRRFGPDGYDLHSQVPVPTSLMIVHSYFLYQCQTNMGVIHRMHDEKTLSKSFFKQSLQRCCLFESRILMRRSQLPKTFILNRLCQTEQLLYYILHQSNLLQTSLPPESLKVLRDILKRMQCNYSTLLYIQFFKRFCKPSSVRRSAHRYLKTARTQSSHPHRTSTLFNLSTPSSSITKLAIAFLSFLKKYVSLKNHFTLSFILMTMPLIFEGYFLFLFLIFISFDASRTCRLT